MLVECGLVRAELGDGRTATFRPSLGRIASLSTPEGLVELFGRLHGPHAPAAAGEVLAGLCDPDDLDALPDLIGEPEPTAAGVAWTGGAMPDAERVIIAQHLLIHGMVGKAKPGGSAKSERGTYSRTFEASTYIAAARVHLGMSAADAEALSMTELQQLLEMKFPDEAEAAAPGGHDVPTREEYEAGMRAFEELKRRREQGVPDHG